MFNTQATTTVMAIRTGSAAVVLPSRLDVHTVDELATRVEHMVRSGATWLTIDADDVRHIDRAGLEFVRCLCRDLDAHDVSYAVGGMSLTMRIALELNGLDAELAQLDSRLAALAAA